jgi:hypothetical protein
VAKTCHILTSGFVIWLLAVAGGFGVLLHYKSVGGSAGTTPEAWPVASQISKDSGLDTLIMFVHPRCPCSRASMEELNRLLAQSSGRVASQVWFSKPKQMASDWVRADLWRSAASIPGVTVHEDAEGAEAHRFGAETSGYVVFYNKEGQLLFHGGITGSRGHAGDNAGENAILTLLGKRGTALNQTPVYGCSLLSKHDDPPNTIDK